MQVDWAIPCRYVEVPAGTGATIVGAGADLVVLREVPAVVQVLFAVRYVGAPDELDGKTPHRVGVRIYNPDSTKAGEQLGEVKSEVEQVVPGWVAELIVPTGIVIEAPEFGTYRVEFSIDQHERPVPIHIVEAP